MHKVVISPKGARPDQYNLWRGFEAESLPAIDKADEDELISYTSREQQANQGSDGSIHFNPAVTKTSC